MGLDLLFLLDATVSMERFRDGVVRQLKHIVSCLEVRLLDSSSWG